MSKVKEKAGSDLSFQWNGKTRGEKDAITKHECLNKIKSILKDDEDDDGAMVETADYISYNFRDRIRVVDFVNVVNDPPNPDAEDDADNDVGDADAEDEEDIKRREEFEAMTRPLKRPRSLPRRASTPRNCRK